MATWRMFLSILGAVLFLGSSEVASAARVSFLARESRVIEGPDGVARVLFDFDGLESLDGKGISSAFLSIPLSGMAPSEDVEVQAFGLETTWRGRATTWMSPWRVAGGDLGYETTIVTLDRGVSSESFRVNVTQIVSRIVTGGGPSNGILLTTPVGIRAGFAETERIVFGDLDGTELIVTYVNSVPPSMRRTE